MWSATFTNQPQRLYRSSADCALPLTQATSHRPLRSLTTPNSGQRASARLKIYEDGRKRQLNRICSRDAATVLSGTVERSASEEIPLEEQSPSPILEGWRLFKAAGAITHVFAGSIERSWESLVDGLELHPTEEEFLYLDSANQLGAGTRSEDLKKGEPGYPRLQIENRCYQSRVFRKLHLEVAVRQDGLEIVHCVMYPRTEYDLPILSLDVVSKDGVVSLGIIDPCPVSLTDKLPAEYKHMVNDLQSRFEVQNNRAVPEWGKEIFSDQCILVRPGSQDELDIFYRYAIALVRVHLKYTQISGPVMQNRASRMKVIRAAHRRFSQQHLKNTKTQRVLAASFGDSLANRYMSEVMFDVDPSAQVG